MEWRTGRRKFTFHRPLVMAILNITPDSFSDGGEYLIVDDAVRQTENMIADGADIIDVGGESTRPGSAEVEPDEEIRRVVPTIEAIAKRFDIPISIDTTKAEVAKQAIDAGAEIINDISGLRFDERIAEVAQRYKSGLILMHSRGPFDTLHTQPPIEDIFAEVKTDLERAIAVAHGHGIDDRSIALDIGIGFGKTQEQNLELIVKLGRLVSEFSEYPMLVGASRKSFIGRLLGDKAPSERLGGSIAAALSAIKNGANIVRVHDVKETVDAIKIAAALNAF